MLNIAVLVSGGGTNLQALLDAQDRGVFPRGRIVLVISSSPEAYALTRAQEKGIATAVLMKRSFPSPEAYDEALLALLQEHTIGLVVLAGFLSILSPAIIARYANRIINVHPSLIPAFCGKGYYGLKVHERALEYGVKVTGATVHFVDEVPDGGAIILQKAVEVQEDDTPQALQKRVMEQAEWVILPQAVALFCENQLTVRGRKVYVSGTEEKG